MRTLSVSLPQEMLEEAQELARKENRTMSELVREALRRYKQQESQAAVNAALAGVLNVIQDSSRRLGLDKMPMEEIDAEIAASRREREKKAAS